MAMMKPIIMGKKLEGAIGEMKKLLNMWVQASISLVNVFVV
jgi:hypothetical protein